MKIIGFIDMDNRVEMVLKNDSSMLTGRKPLFLPEDCTSVEARECVVLRVSKLGKHIDPSFASRYWDAAAPAADLLLSDRLEVARAEGRSWAPAMAFDGSLVIGEWGEADALPDDLWLSAEEAIAQASREMTIRQGDLIYIARQQPTTRYRIGDTIHHPQNTLYCKIK